MLGGVLKGAQGCSGVELAGLSCRKSNEKLHSRTETDWLGTGQLLTGIVWRTSDGCVQMPMSTNNTIFNVRAAAHLLCSAELG